MKLGDVIASIRRKKRIGQKDMAIQLGISVSYLSQIENNSRMASSKLLNKISDVLGVPVSALLFEALQPSAIADEEKRRLYLQAKSVMDEMLSILLTD